MSEFKFDPRYRFSTTVECTGCLRKFTAEDSGEVAHWILRHQEECQVIKQHIVALEAK